MNLDAQPGEVNGRAFDRFTLVHFAAGAAAAKLGVPPLLAVAAAIGWELCEDRLKDSYPNLFPNATHDLKANAVVDLGAFALALLLLHRGR